MSARTRKDWILWGALGCALVSTAHAEYTLATAAHFNGYVALAVPGALDLYVIRALQQRRDVLVAVLAMVAANVASHLIAGGVLDVTWHVIAAVGAVAPLIVWRVYSLKYTRNRQELLWGLEAGAVSAPVPEDEYAPECTCTWWRRALAWLGWGRYACECTPSAPHPGAPGTGVDMENWAPGYHLDGCDGVHAHEGPFHCQVRRDALHLSAPDPSTDGHDGWAAKSLIHPHAPDHVPADWMSPSAVPYLHPVPDLPDEYAPSAVHSVTESLKPGDLELLPAARDYVDRAVKPSVRGLKDALKIGQERAERLLTHLGVKS